MENSPVHTNIAEASVNFALYTFHRALTAFPEATQVFHQAFLDVLSSSSFSHVFHHVIFSCALQQNASARGANYGLRCHCIVASPQGDIGNQTQQRFRIERDLPMTPRGEIQPDLKPWDLVCKHLPKHSCPMLHMLLQAE